MAYSTRAQVQAQFKRITFSASSAVSESDVDQFIEDADAEIDAEIGTRYTVPVTGGTSALNLLRRISVEIVAERIRDILATKTPDGKTSSEQGPISRFDARGMLKKIKDGTVRLASASVAGSGVYSENYSEDVEPLFDAEAEQW